MAKKELVQCYQCHEWFAKIESGDIFMTLRHPSHWFFLNFRLASGMQYVEFCSWLCTKNFVDTMYAKHHHEDLNAQAPLAHYHKSPNNQRSR